MSLIGTILGTLLTSPTDEKTLLNFYKITRPFGSWKRFKSQMSTEQQLGIDSENKRDIISTIMAVPWQVVFFMFMLSLIFKTWLNVSVLGVLLVVLTIGLYYTWYRHLSTEVKVDN